MKILRSLYKNYLFSVLLMFMLNFSGLLAQPSAYFQQEVNYEINVTLNDRKHSLSAFETIHYINNSPDTLSFLYFHLWPNAYSNDNTCLARQLLRLQGKRNLFSDPVKAGFIDSLDFRAGQESLTWELLPDMVDVCRITLKNPLNPGDTLIISTPFHVKIPDGQVSRLGHTGWAYQISQWYPKPAVYDAHGWHPMPYLDQGEFFSEYGSFRVSITLPGDYTVGASGDLITESELARLNKMAADSSWMFRRSGEARPVPTAPSGESMKTLQYRGENIHDFAWFADREFNVLRGQVVIPSGKQVGTMALFTNLEAYLWINSVNYINNAIRKFSEWIGEYPYNQFTAVQSALSAGSGMEYPGLTVVGSATDPYTLDQVIAHEICHSWFYSSIGSDERDFPFMDEGITNSYESRYLDYFYPGLKLWEVYMRNKKMARFLNLEDLPVDRISELEWLVQARSNLDQPANLTSQKYTELNYNNIIYYKTGKSFNLLRNYLGDSLYDSIMHSYFREWGNRHPYPADLRRIFEEGSGKDLRWFFDDILATTKKIDYKVIREKDDSVLISNKGRVAAPFPVTGLYGGNEVFTEWYDGFPGRKWVKLPVAEYSSLRINRDHVLPELYYLNNNTRKSGIFRKADRLSPRLLFSVEDPDKISVMYTPLLNWNRNDGAMIGLAMNNGTLLQKPIEYSVLPFVRLRNGSIAGKGRVAYNVFPYNSFIRKASVSLDGSKFGAPFTGNYKLLRAGLDIYFRNKSFPGQVSHMIYGRFIEASDIRRIMFSAPTMNYFWQTGYVYESTFPANPHSVEVSFESGRTKPDAYSKASVTFKYTHYDGNINKLDLRLYAGTMIDRVATNSMFSLSPSARPGDQLYLFQGEFPDRFNTSSVFWRQVVITEGGLISPVGKTFGYRNWLMSASTSFCLPGVLERVPVRPFINLLLTDPYYTHSGFFYEAGLKAGIRDILEVYLPFLLSGNGTSYINFSERIRFVLNLDTFIRFRVGTAQR